MVHSFQHFSLARQGPRPQAGGPPLGMQVQAEGWAHQGHSAGWCSGGGEGWGLCGVCGDFTCLFLGSRECLLLVILSSRVMVSGPSPNSQLLLSGFPARHPSFTGPPCRGCGMMTCSLLGFPFGPWTPPEAQPGWPLLCNPLGSLTL